MPSPWSLIAWQSGSFYTVFLLILKYCLLCTQEKSLNKDGNIRNTDGEIQYLSAERRKGKSTAHTAACVRHSRRRTWATPAKTWSLPSWIRHWNCHVQPMVLLGGLTDGLCDTTGWCAIRWDYEISVSFLFISWLSQGLVIVTELVNSYLNVNQQNDYTIKEDVLLLKHNA